jgi:hypothetical protein
MGMRRTYSNPDPHGETLGLRKISKKKYGKLIISYIFPLNLEKYN